MQHGYGGEGMNKKLYFNLVFYLIGTFVVIFMGIIMTYNFAKDARVFQKSIVTASEDTKPGTVNVGTQPEETAEQTAGFGTIKYERTPGSAVEETKDYGEDIPAKTAKIKVEVINYTSIKKLAEDIRTTLEASGYDVSAGNGKSDKPMKTMIVERNDKKSGAEIQKILKAGTVVRWPDSKSRFDVTVIIGDDYRP